MADPRPTYAAPFIKGDWDKAVYLDSVHADNLMTAFLSLGAEFWAMRRRMMVLEKFLGEKRVVSLAALEAYEPTAQEKVAWDADRDDYISRVYSVLTRETAPLPGAQPIMKK